MKELRAWWAEAGEADRRPWLLLGKGPSLERKDEFALGDYRTLGLNHVVARQPVDVAGVMDIEVVADLGDVLEANAGTLLMPRFPRVGCGAHDRPLEDYFDQHQVLRRLSEAGRLVWFNYLDGRLEGDSPAVPKGHFSAEVMVNLLALLGVKQIYNLGVDGGGNYAPGFDTKDRLANRQPDFDVQWQGMAATVRHHGIEYIPLDTEVPIRVFIGTDESQRLGARVLEYSIKRHTPVPVVCDTMDAVQAPKPKDPSNQARTEFSFDRFAIPALCGYHGRGVYLDADMQVFRNFRELWDLPFDGATVLYAPSSDPGKRVSQFSVMLLDCGTLKWGLDEIVRGLDAGDYDYEKLMRSLCIEEPEKVRDRIPQEWNSLEKYEPGKTGLIHYTDMHTQPWVSCRNPNGDVWVKCLRDAIKDGFITQAELDEGFARGFLRPSLRWQLRMRRRYWPFFNRYLAPLIDRRFRPHKRLWKRLKGVAKAG